MTDYGLGTFSCMSREEPGLALLGERLRMEDVSYGSTLAGRSRKARALTPKYTLTQSARQKQMLSSKRQHAELSFVGVVPGPVEAGVSRRNG